MNIALFTDTYFPDINGIVSSTHVLYQELVKHHHHVLIVTTQLPQDSDYQDDEENVLRLPGIPIKSLYGYRASSIYSIKGMKEIKEFDPDLIHIQTEFGIGIFGKIVGEELNIPVCYTYHTLYSDYTHYIVPNNMKSMDKAAKKVVEKVSKIYGESCAALIVPSQKTADILKSYGIEREINVVPTGLNLDIFRKRDESLIKHIKEQYHLENKFVVTYIGRIAKEKSIDMLLYGFRRIKNVNENIVLMIVGGGPMEQELQQLAIDLEIDDVVIFAGKKKTEEIPSYYQVSSLFVSASLSETQGLTLIEAMAAGIVLLARYDKNLENVVVEGENGYFFHNEDELVEKILQLADKDLTKLAHNAYEAANHYSSSIFYDDIMAVYNKALDHHYYCYHVKSIDQDDNRYMVTFTCDRHEIPVRVSKDLLARYELRVGQVIDREQLDALRDHEQAYNAYHCALKLLTYKDYTYKMMMDKLASKYDFTDIQLDMAMELLMEKNLINDRQYTEDYFEKAKTMNIGIYKIIDKLKQDGVSTAIIDEYAENYSTDDEYDKVKAFIEKQYNDNTTRSPNALIASIRNKLYNKGYSTSVVDQAINDFSFDYPEDHLKMLLSKEYYKVYKRYSRQYEGNELKNKIIHFLLQKGYKYDDILESVEELWQKE